MTSTALITGVTGQDGSYLAELLLARGYRVVGVVRDPDADRAREALGLGVELTTWDPGDAKRIAGTLREVAPSEIYNMAAYSSGSGMFDDPVAIGDVNGLVVARILEAIREVDATIRFCQASSSEMFGEAAQSPQTERTAFSPRSPYGAAKVYAHSMIGIYRRRYGLFGCSAILFNHESPRRGLAFVTRKIAREAARIKLGLAGELRLGNLDARRDWGFAGDYARAMWLMLQQPGADDYVVATGATHSVRDFCDLAFARLGLNYRDYVREDAAAYRAAEPVQLVGNAEKARRELGWEPEVQFEPLVHMMVDAELRELRGANTQG